MPSPIIADMIDKHGYPILETDTVDAFVAANDEVVLFFAENPVQYPESNDVAMILPELVSAFGGRFRAALVGRSAERVLQARYGFNTWPALVFLRGGGYLGAITQVQNWQDYLQRIQALLDAEPTRAPGFAIPVVSEPAAGCHH